jgi:hypothetical protein
MHAESELSRRNFLALGGSLEGPDAAVDDDGVVARRGRARR